MKKLVTILTALTLALGMTACAGKDSSTLKVGDLTTTAPADVSGTDTSDTSGTDTSGVDDSIFEGDIFGGSAGGGISLWIFNEYGKVVTGGDISYEPLDINKGFKVTARSDFSSNEMKGDVTANLYFFCNGQIIKHSLEENGEYTEKSTVTLPNGVVHDFDVYIAPTDLGEFERGQLWALIEFVPDYVPKTIMGEYLLIDCSYMPVFSSGTAADEAPSVYEAQEQDYINGEHPATLDNPYSEEEDPSIHYVEIGKYDESIHDVGGHGYSEIPIIDKDADFAVTAYITEDADYYIAVFCDGEPINAFDGKMFMKVNCQDGKRMVKYSLDKENLPENGDHAYSVVAFTDQEIVVELQDGPATSIGSDCESFRHIIKIDM